MYKFVLILLIFTSCPIGADQVKVAVIGDSITFGSGAEVRKNNRYASRLGYLLGRSYDVRVFAASSLCMLRKADKPYVATKHFRDALSFKPDIAVVTLGTNDTCENSKRKNWVHHDDLRDDALYLIGQLRKSNPNVILHLCSPPPMFPNQPGLKPARKKDLKERSKRLPVINRAYSQVAAGMDNVYFHDMSRGLQSNETTDGVHPHTFGHERLGHRYFSIITQPVGVRARFKESQGTRSEWHGFERYDGKLAKSGARYTLVLPHVAAKGQPWVWRARFFGHQPALDLALLDRGYHLAYVDVENLYGSREAIKRCDELYRHLTSSFGLNTKCIMEGMSRGGLTVFNYAAKYPDRVSAVYGDNPVCDFTSWPGGQGEGKGSQGDWGRCLKAYGITSEEAAQFPQITAESFARQLKNIPVALVVGTKDQVVPPNENSLLLARNLKAQNHPLKVWLKPGLGHHPHGLSPVDPLLRFLLRSDGRVSNPAAHAEPSPEYRGGAGWGGNWWQAFAHLKLEAKKHSDARVVFLGDSISQGLTGHRNRATVKNGSRAIDRCFPGDQAISLGLSGDRTEHVLYRLNHGLLDDLKPSHLILMIGVNNIGAGHTGEEAAAGTKEIVTWLKKNRPEIKVLLLGCFPKGKRASHPARVEVQALHDGVRPLADNKTVFYQDLRHLFLNADGSMNDRMAGDAIHINSKGQTAWLKAVKNFTLK